MAELTYKQAIIAALRNYPGGECVIRKRNLQAVGVNLGNVRLVLKGNKLQVLDPDKYAVPRNVADYIAAEAPFAVVASKTAQKARWEASKKANA